MKRLFICKVCLHCFVLLLFKIILCHIQLHAASVRRQKVQQISMCLYSMTHLFLFYRFYHIFTQKMHNNYTSAKGKKVNYLENSWSHTTGKKNEVKKKIVLLFANLPVFTNFLSSTKCKKECWTTLTFIEWI